MKALIFENEFNAIKTSFDGFNLLYFDNQLEFDVFPSSQSFELSNLKDYDVVIVDIDLSIKSKLDGLQLLDEFLKAGYNDIKIMILTGHLTINERLKELKLPEYPVINKPINLTTIKNAFDHYNLTPTTI